METYIVVNEDFRRYFMIIKLNDYFKSKSGPIVMCIGYFDGIHLGHQQLIKKTIEIARKQNMEPVLFTFDPSPAKILGKDKYYGEITSLQDRDRILSELGIKTLVVMDFNSQTMNEQADDFVHNVIIKMNVKTLICGFDFRYGFKGKGNTKTLQDYYEFNTIIIPSYDYSGAKVSTSRIINLLKSKSVREANLLLGHNFKINGFVIHGLNNGGRIGFRTANIELGDYVMPSIGVYACYAYFNGVKYKAMVNIGIHPTISELEKPIMEVHILDFDQNLYGKFIEVEFVDYIRDEIKFDDIENLKSQIIMDTKTIAKILY